MARLVASIYVDGPNGVAVFGPDDDVPEWAARKMGAHCFEGGEHPYPDQPDAEQEQPAGPPAKAGPKASKDAWVAYAEANNVDVSDLGTRDEIIAALAEAGVPTE